MAKKFRPNQGQQTMLTVLAHILAASNIDKMLKELYPETLGRDFFNTYIENLDADQKAIWDAFNSEAKRAYQKIAKELEKEMATKP